MDSTPGQVYSTPEESLGPDAIAQYQFKRRLVVCLDGTWNARDSGTNIYHIANLVLEGRIDASKEGDETWIQMVYYDEGVGTSFLTSATGGALGVGLSENVRQAYDWLVEKYREGDHVYIFGFSRGSFTARSLVGLISNCGLLNRGAPLPPEELWNGYRNMGLDLKPSEEEKLPARKWWQPFGHPESAPFHRLKYLKPDPGAAQDEYELIPAEKMNEAERLLCVWSRRIPIECLAIIDTVRTLGIEALAIPWLQDRRSQFHDTRLTTRIQNGFHALAIDEHRANFDRIPWLRKTKSATTKEKERTETDDPIRQKWFIGAHSNVGGSYYDDTLAQWSLKWFIKECSALGLVFKPLWKDDPKIQDTTDYEDCVPLWKDKENPAKPAHICDSYTEFARGIWRHLIRAKRNYRRIAPPPEFQSGNEMESVKEELHESVEKLIALNNGPANVLPKYNPPNLYEYRERMGLITNASKPKHVYLDGPKATLWLLLWLFGIGAGGAWIASFMSSPWWGSWWGSLAGILPLLAWLVDWTESSINHAQAVERLDSKSESRDGMLDLLLNVRIAAIGLFLVGAIYFIWEAIWSLWFDLPLAEVLWLLAFCAMMIHVHASMMWAAQPMQEAGFGSITALQDAKNSTAVIELLRKWMDGPADEYRRRLTPVYRTIWRDRIGFIPAYTIAFFFAIWMIESLIVDCFWPEYFGERILGLLSGCHWCWGPAALIALSTAGADYIEDMAHVGYLDRVDTPPKSVWLGRLATLIKTVGVYVGMFGLTVAVLSLALLQFYRLAEHLCPRIFYYEFMKAPPLHFSPAIFNLLSAALAIFLTISTMIAISKRHNTPQAQTD